ncbi:MAG: hypothetical protein ABIQ58_09850 [Candidatus Limnocylindrales bacterium]
MTMIHRTALFVGVTLAAAGTVMLVGATDTAAGDAITQALRLWPLAIVALGVGLIVRRTRFAVVGTLVAATLAGLVVGGVVVAAPNADSFCENGDGASKSTRNGSLLSPATVKLSLACGEVQVTTVKGSAWELRSRDLGGRSAVVTETSERLEIRSDADRWDTGFGPHGDVWQLALPTDATIDLDAEVNAGRGRFDLAGATIGSLAIELNAGEARLDLGASTVNTLDVKVNAGSATVLLPARSDLNGELDVTVGAIEICAPAGLGIRIHGDAEFGSTEFNGLLRVADAWETPNLSTAPYLAELSVSAQAGSVVVNPAGGCK